MKIDNNNLFLFQLQDGEELPPQISFDVGNEGNLPVPKASFLCDPAGADIIRQFLEQYFIVYDSASRQPLLDAYHENAMFSMTVGAYQQGSQSKWVFSIRIYLNCNLNYKFSPRLTNYFNISRNLTRIRENDLKIKHLKYGRLPVVSFLTELPATQHDPQSFAVDLTLFTVSGRYFEGSVKTVRF